MKRARRNHGAFFKAQVALAAIKGDKTVAEWAEHFQVHPTQAAGVLGSSKPPADAPDLKTLHAKIRQLTLENDFSKARSPRRAC